ncbi:MAG: hypothetical protein JXR07_03820 [Reichenbachiella sp.]
MKHNFYLLLAVVWALTLACSPDEKEQLTGELYFPWLKMGNFYGKPDSVIQHYFQMRDSVGLKKLSEEDPAGTAYMKLLEENDLLFEPYVYMRMEEDQNALVFMDSVSYQSFKKIDYQTLITNKQKVRVKATVQRLRPLIYLTEKINRIDIVSGETFPKESKYRIENYQ